jgi:hypothetical protein
MSPFRVSLAALGLIGMMASPLPAMARGGGGGGGSGGGFHGAFGPGFRGGFGPGLGSVVVS